MGGSQRLTRAIGKAKAIELCLSGRIMDAGEVEGSGLVSRVVPAEILVEEALKTAAVIAGMAPLAAIAYKEMIDAAFETMLTQGLTFAQQGAPARVIAPTMFDRYAQTIGTAPNAPVPDSGKNICAFSPIELSCVLTG